MYDLWWSKVDRNGKLDPWRGRRIQAYQGCVCPSTNPNNLYRYRLCYLPRYDAGIQTFDTAGCYSNGLSETVLGNAIKHFNLPRDEIVIMTKVCNKRKSVFHSNGWGMDYPSAFSLLDELPASSSVEARAITQMILGMSTNTGWVARTSLPL